jgi:Cupin domain
MAPKGGIQATNDLDSRPDLGSGNRRGAIGHRLLNAQPQPAKRTPLLKSDVPMEGKEANILLVEMAPGATSGQHYHPTDTLVYVLGGALTFEYVDRQLRHFPQSFGFPTILRSRSRCRSSTRRILPLMVFGSSAVNSISRGYL